MESFLIEWFPSNLILAFLISIFLNILVAISGVLPSAAITAVNIILFGFEAGLLVSITGEAAGAIISFILYRKGLSRLSSGNFNKQVKLLNKLKDTKGAGAVFLVLILRVLPFVPSGAVTLAAAYSKMGLLAFSTASTLGKIPSLLIEAYSVDQLLSLSPEWQLLCLLFLLLFAVIYYFLKGKGHSSQK